MELLLRLDAMSSMPFSSSSATGSSAVAIRPTPIPPHHQTAGHRLPPARPVPPSIVTKAITRRENRTARHERIREKVQGTQERPRMSVSRSNKHFYVQVIDDVKMRTLASVSTMQKSLSEYIDYTSGPTMEVAKKVGEIIAKSCLEEGITKVAVEHGLEF